MLGLAGALATSALQGCWAEDSPVDLALNPEKEPRPGLLRCWSGGEVVFERCVDAEVTYFSRGSGSARALGTGERLHINGNCVIVEGACPEEAN